MVWKGFLVSGVLHLGRLHQGQGPQLNPLLGCRSAGTGYGAHPFPGAWLAYIPRV